MSDKGTEDDVQMFDQNKSVTAASKTTSPEPKTIAKEQIIKTEDTKGGGSNNSGFFSKERSKKKYLEKDVPPPAKNITKTGTAPKRDLSDTKTKTVQLLKSKKAGRRSYTNAGEELDVNRGYRAPGKLYLWVFTDKEDMGYDRLIRNGKSNRW